MAKNNLSFLEKVTVNEYLSQVIVKLAGEQTCSYKQGVTDDTVAAAMKFRCTAVNVASVRKEVYGALNRDAGYKLSLEMRIANLEGWARTQGFEIEL